MEKWNTEEEIKNLCGLGYDAKRTPLFMGGQQGEPHDYHPNRTNSITVTHDNRHLLVCGQRSDGQSISNKDDADIDVILLTGYDFAFSGQLKDMLAGKKVSVIKTTAIL